jgi:hypothetical protein
MKPKKNSLLLSWICKKKHVLDNYHKFQTTISSSQLKGILKLILVIFCIYETLNRFLSMKLCKSDIIR